MEKKDIDRINELARKKKTIGLTESEVQEHERLRRQYIDEFKANVRMTLEHTYIQESDGTRRPLRQRTPDAAQKK